LDASILHQPGSMRRIYLARPPPASKGVKAKNQRAKTKKWLIFCFLIFAVFAF
jgi:hypothetical protein